MNGLVMTCMMFANGAMICTQSQLSASEAIEYKAESPYGKWALPSEPPYRCAWPADLAERLGVPPCEQSFVERWPSK